MAASDPTRIDELAATAKKDESTFGYKLSIGHQEIDKIVDEVESIFNSQPTEWLAVEPIGHMITNVCDWYEDYDEFEDAIGGTFEEFLRALPQFEVRSSSEGKPEFRLLQPVPDSPPTVMTLRVTESADLWRVLFKSPDASIRFPEIEFEIGADSKRRIDSVYNHITAAIWNLTSHLRGQKGDATTEQAEGITTVVDQLTAYLDIEEPFTIVVDDATGTSMFKPSDGVDVQTL